MRVKCTITIDDAEFTATSDDGHDEGSDVNILAGRAIAGCIAAIGKADYDAVESIVVADVCLQSDESLLWTAGWATREFTNLSGLANDFRLVVARDVIDDKDEVLPTAIIAVPDIAAARAAIQG